LALGAKKCFNLVGHSIEVFAEVRNFVSPACEPGPDSGGEISACNAARCALQMQDRPGYVMGKNKADQRRGECNC